MEQLVKYLISTGATPAAAIKVASQLLGLGRRVEPGLPGLPPRHLNGMYNAGQVP